MTRDKRKCRWNDGAFCNKGLPGTLCDVYTCVAYMEIGGREMTKEEQQLYWMDRAKEYAKSVATENLYQWQIDALYVAFLNGVQAALKIRLI